MGPNDDIIVYFYPENKKLSLKTLMEFIKKMLEEDEKEFKFKHAIIIGKEKPNSNVMKVSILIDF